MSVIIILVFFAYVIFSVIHKVNMYLIERRATNDVIRATDEKLRLDQDALFAMRTMMQEAQYYTNTNQRQTADRKQ